VRAHGSMHKKTAAKQHDAVNSFLNSSSHQPLLKGVQIFRAGDYTHKNKGAWNNQDLQQIASHFEMLKAAGEHVPPLKSSHEDDNRGNPVLGWAEKVYAVGRDLFADFRLVSNQVMDLIKRKAFRFRSAELHDKPRPWTRPDGTRMANVLRAVSFVPIPEVKGMEEISATLSESGLAYVALAAEDESGVALNFQRDEMDPNAEKKKDGTQDPEAESTQAQGTEGEGEADAEDENAETGETEDGTDSTEAEDGDEAETEDEDEATDGADAEDSADNADKAATCATPAAKKKAAKMGTKGKAKKTAAPGMQDEDEPEDEKEMKQKGFGYPVPVKNADSTRLPKFGDSGMVIPAGIQFSDADMQAALDNLDPATVRRMALDSVKAAQQAAFSEAEAWVKAQVEAGKILPKFKDVALALASPNLGGMGKVSYADGQDPLPVNALFRMYVEGTTPSVQFGETAGQKGANSGQEDGVNMSAADADSEANRVYTGKSKAEWAAMSDSDKAQAVKATRGELTE